MSKITAALSFEPWAALRLSFSVHSARIVFGLGFADSRQRVVPPSDLSLTLSGEPEGCRGVGATAGETYHLPDFRLQR